MEVTVFFSAVAEYSDALKESIRSQTEYLVNASPAMSNVRTDQSTGMTSVHNKSTLLVIQMKSTQITPKRKCQ